MVSVWQDIDIKKQGAVSAYAFVQYADIQSVVKALRHMDGEHIGNNKIKVTSWCRALAASICIIDLYRVKQP